MSITLEIPTGVADPATDRKLHHQKKLSALIQAKRLGAAAGFLVAVGTLLVTWAGYRLSKEIANADTNRSVEEQTRSQLMADSNVILAVAQISAAQKLYFTEESNANFQAAVDAIKSHQPILEGSPMETAVKQHLSFYENVATIRTQLKSPELQILIDSLHKLPAQAQFEKVMPWIIEFRKLPHHETAYLDQEIWFDGKGGR